MTRTKQKKSVTGIFVAALGACALSMSGALAADLSVTVTGPTGMMHNMVVPFTVHPANGNAFPLPNGVVATVTTAGIGNVTIISTTPGAGWIQTGPTTFTYSAGRPVNTAFPPITLFVKASGHGSYQVCAHISFVPNAGTQPDQVPGNNAGCVVGHIPSFP